tara:strand:+ start:77 stop:415 length:339 start_codon:yes stop_codon:yes gene_type:complete
MSIEKITSAIGEMTVAMCSADGIVSDIERDHIDRLKPEYLNLLDGDLFHRLLAGYKGVPDFTDKAKEISDLLTNDEKKHFYNYFKELAECDFTDLAEQRFLDQLTEIWSLEN